jgi:hypothetical protein
MGLKECYGHHSGHEVKNYGQIFKILFFDQKCSIWSIFVNSQGLSSFTKGFQPKV